MALQCALCHPISVPVRGVDSTVQLAPGKIACHTKYNDAGYSAQDWQGVQLPGPVGGCGDSRHNPQGAGGLWTLWCQASGIAHGTSSLQHRPASTQRAEYLNVWLYAASSLHQLPGLACAGGGVRSGHHIRHCLPAGLQHPARQQRGSPCPHCETGWGVCMLGGRALSGVVYEQGLVRGARKRSIAGWPTRAELSIAAPLRAAGLQTLRRPLAFAIVDEVDSVLIDECRNPFIISLPGSTANFQDRWRTALQASGRTAGVGAAASSCQASVPS